MHPALIAPRKPSSAIAGYRYLPLQKKLLIAFIGGTTGTYAGVEPALATSFISASSLGTFLANRIKPSFDWTPCGDAGIDALMVGEAEAGPIPPIVPRPAMAERLLQLLALNPARPRLI